MDSIEDFNINKPVWPWTEKVISKTDLKLVNWPKISIVTPSYNQGQFIEETILSVLNQNYPNLEYIIIDGGSTDNTIEIIRKYESKLTYWESVKDRGQTHAINKGFEKASGEILAYLNSDDCFYDNSFFIIANEFLKNNGNDDFLFIGNCYCAKSLDDKNGELDIPNFPGSLIKALEKKFLAPQPSMFWTMRNHKLKFNESLKFCMDFEFWLQLITSHYKVIRINETLSFFRDHLNSKSNNLHNILNLEIHGVSSIYLKNLAVQKESIQLRLANLNAEIYNVSELILESLKEKRIYEGLTELLKSKLPLGIRIYTLKRFLRTKLSKRQ